MSRVRIYFVVSCGFFLLVKCLKRSGLAVWLITYGRPLGAFWDWSRLVSPFSFKFQRKIAAI